MGFTLTNKLKKLEKDLYILHPGISNDKKDLSVERYMELMTKAISPLLETMSDDHKEELLANMERFRKREEIDRDEAKPTYLVKNYVVALLDKKHPPLLYLGTQCYEAYKKGASALKECKCNTIFPFFGGHQEIQDGKLVTIHPISVVKQCPLCGESL